MNDLHYEFDLGSDAPHPGHWHLVVDLGGYPGTVRGNARVLEGAT
jgi:hypothetical protein